MILTFTNDFATWVQVDDNVIDSHKLTIIQNSEAIAVRNKLLSLGISSESLYQIFSQISLTTSLGVALFSDLKVLTWYWSNGDNIVFPINSKGQVYLGNDSSLWIDYWPFLHQVSPGIYSCNLETIEITLEPELVTKSFLIGGQSHFGHSIMNKLAGLFYSHTFFPLDIRDPLHILTPHLYSKLQLRLLCELIDLPVLNVTSLPAQNSIITLKNVYYSSVPRTISLLTPLKGILASKYSTSLSFSSNPVYISRSSNASHDRLANYPQFLNYLRSLGFVVVNLSSLSFSDRLSLLGRAPFILSDSGSSWINSYLFGSGEAIRKNMIPARVFDSLDPSVLSQLILNLDILFSCEFELLQSAYTSAHSPWYDICEPPFGRIITP